MRRHRAGFTLVELLTVIVILGILASIAVARFGNSRERAYYKSMMSDLRNLIAQQEVYFATPGIYTYAENVDALNVSESAGVNLTLAGVSKLGWQATATHDGLATTQTCGIYFGTPTTAPPAYVDVPGIVRCTNE